MAPTSSLCQTPSTCACKEHAVNPDPFRVSSTTTRWPEVIADAPQWSSVQLFCIFLTASPPAPATASVVSIRKPCEQSAYSARHPGRADYTSGFLHSAVLSGLKPSTKYYYSCGDDALAMSSVRSFVTPPKIGANQPITLGILGDLGQTEDSG